MQLNKKKELAARTLGVGKERIVFNRERLEEIKEAIARQDIRDLIESKAIFVQNPTGKRKLTTRKTRRRSGSIKKKVNVGKKTYMAITRKLRAYISELKRHGTIKVEEYRKLRKEIRARDFKSKAHMKDRITRMVAERR